MSEDRENYLDMSVDDEDQLQPEDTLAGLLAEHERVAAATDARIRELDSLDVVHELPKSPWPMDAEWSVRNVARSASVPR